MFVKFHIDNYDNQFPLWVISELFTFGTLSYFCNDLTTADKKAFVSIIKCLVVFHTPIR